jgi:hypothetical protein
MIPSPPGTSDAIEKNMPIANPAMTALTGDRRADGDEGAVEHQQREDPVEHDVERRRQHVVGTLQQEIEPNVQVVLEADQRRTARAVMGRYPPQHAVDQPRRAE